ncbi:hypothetical protein RRG08_041234 [Elysia crispata]|uniref:Uncharacterized protein n=1 Tax=Elysia crispata TaxID=231223 RepID=A0AAE0YWJ1_9GAST|nr:hypothetical protein RRG08_041234 [Elysia crispata]
MHLYTPLSPIIPSLKTKLALSAERPGNQSFNKKWVLYKRDGGLLCEEPVKRALDWETEMVVCYTKNQSRERWTGKQRWWFVIPRTSQESAGLGNRDGGLLYQEPVKRALDWETEMVVCYAKNQSRERWTGKQRWWFVIPRTSQESAGLGNRDGGLLYQEPVKRALDWETEMVVCYTKNQSRERWTGKQRWWFVIPRTSQESAGLGNRDGGLLYEEPVKRALDWETEMVVCYAKNQSRERWTGKQRWWFVMRRTSQESAGLGNRDGGLLYQEPVKRALDWETEMVVCYTKNQSRERWTGKQRWWFVIPRTSQESAGLGNRDGGLLYQEPVKRALDWETEMVVCYTKNQSRERWTGKQRWWFVIPRTSQESAGLGNRDGGLLYQEPVKRALDWETEMVVCYTKNQSRERWTGKQRWWFVMRRTSQESAGLGNRDGGLLYQEPVKRALDWETEMVVCYTKNQSRERWTGKQRWWFVIPRTSQESAGLGNRDGGLLYQEPVKRALDWETEMVVCYTKNQSRERWTGKQRWWFVIPRTSQESAGLGNRDGGLLYQEPVKRALDWETEMVVCYTKNQSRERWTGKQRWWFVMRRTSQESAGLGNRDGGLLYQEPVKRALDWETEMVVCYAKNQSRERWTGKQRWWFVIPRTSQESAGLGNRDGGLLYQEPVKRALDWETEMVVCYTKNQSRERWTGKQRWWFVIPRTSQESAGLGNRDGGLLYQEPVKRALDWETEMVVCYTKNQSRERWTGKQRWWFVIPRTSQESAGLGNRDGGLLYQEPVKRALDWETEMVVCYAKNQSRERWTGKQRWWFVIPRTSQESAGLGNRDGGLLCEESVKRALDWETEMVVCYTKNQSRERWTGKQRWWFVMRRTSQESAGLGNRDGGLLYQEPVKRALDWETEMVVCYAKNQSRERWTGKQRWWFVMRRTSQESAGLGNRDGGLLYQEPVKRALDWETEMVVCYAKNQSRERWTGKQRWWFVMRRTSQESAGLGNRDGGLLCEEPVKRALDWETEMVVCYTKNQSRERWTGKQRWWFVIPRTSQESAGLGNRDGGLLYQEPVKRALDWETEMVVCYAKNQSRERWTGKQRWWFVIPRTSQESAGLGNRDGGLLCQEPVKRALDWETEMVVCYTKNQSRERWTGKQRWWFVIPRTSQESAGLGNRDGGLLNQEPVKRALDWETEMEESDSAKLAVSVVGRV